jgi:hypothetical protein
VTARNSSALWVWLKRRRIGLFSFWRGMRGKILMLPKNNPAPEWKEKKFTICRSLCHLKIYKQKLSSDNKEQ